MKTLLAILIMITSTLPALAQNDRNDTMMHKGMDHGQMMRDGTPGDMMGMMSAGQMDRMREHMQEMGNIMQRLQKETDPEERRQLLQEHMRNMQEGMYMMNHGEGTDMSSMGTDQRIRMMEERMNMMQMMMGQMLEHEAQMDQPKKAPAPRKQ